MDDERRSDDHLLAEIARGRAEIAATTEIACADPSFMARLDPGLAEAFGGIGGFREKAGAVALMRLSDGLGPRDRAFVLAQAGDGVEGDYAQGSLMLLADDYAREGGGPLDRAAAEAVRAFLLRRRERASGLVERLRLSKALGSWAAAAGDFATAADHVVEQGAAGSVGARIMIAVAEPERWRTREEAIEVVEAAREAYAAAARSGAGAEARRKALAVFEAVEAVAIHHSGLAGDPGWAERLTELLDRVEPGIFDDGRERDAATRGLLAALRAGS